MQETVTEPAARHPAEQTHHCAESLAGERGSVHLRRGLGICSRLAGAAIAGLLRRSFAVPTAELPDTTGKCVEDSRNADAPAAAVGSGSDAAASVPAERSGRPMPPQGHV